MNTPAHVFLTRFNLPSPGVESLIQADESWLVDRMVLFERYTIPSVRAQLGGDIHWIVYVDPQSPTWLLSRLSELQSEGIMVPIERRSVSPEELHGDVRGVVGRPRGPVISSNLDNDDGLATDFVQRLRGIATPQPRSAVYLSHGLIKLGTRVYLRSDPQNAFCAVREDLADLATCWADWHNRLDRLMPRVSVAGPPGWLQVIHGTNVSNRVRGRLISPRSYRSAFPGLLDDVTEPTRTQILRDEFVNAPRRVARDTARGTGRDILVRCLGKERYGELRYAVASATRGLRQNRSHRA